MLVQVPETTLIFNSKNPMCLLYSKPFHKGMLCKFKSSPRERLIIAKKANQWKGTYHPWFLSSRAKNCATKPIPRQNIRFRDFGSDGSVSERKSPAAAAIRDKNGDVWEIGRLRFLGTWPNLSGVADIRPGMWHISIARYCRLCSLHLHTSIGSRC
jgi:hypothetical protein